MVSVTPAGITPGAASDGSVVHASDAALGDLSRAHDERDISRLQAAIHPYDAAKTYEVNDVVSFNNQAQICLTQITVPEVFDPSKWQVSSSGKGILMISFGTDSPASNEYFALSGGPRDGQSAEADAQAPIPTTLTIFEITLFVQSNNLGTSTTWVLRINGADGNSTLTIGAGLTGFFENLVDFDDVVAGDLVCYQYREGGGAGGLTIIGASCETRNTE